MPCRVSYRWFLSQSKIGGWSENFWHSNDDIAVVQPAADDLRVFLLSVKASGVVNTSVKIQQVAIGGDPQTFRKALSNDTGEQFNPQNPTGVDADFIATGLLLQIRHAPLYLTSQKIGGIPDDQVNSGGYYKPTSAYKRKVASLLAYLASGKGWGMVVQNKTIEKKKIVNISNTGTVRVPSHGYANGDRVRIFGITSYPAINKIWTITTNPGDGDTFDLRFWTAPPTGTVFTGNNPTVQKQSKTFVAPDSIDALPPGVSIKRATKVNAGRPSGLLIGRRKRRRS